MLFIYVVFAALFGLMAGSFLNVVIYRLPIMLERSWQREARQVLDIENTEAETPFNLSIPRSACPKCRAPVKAWQNIPVISFLLLRGRCANCHTPISWRYPLVELITAAAFATVVWRFGWTPTAWFGLALTAALIALFFIDADTQLLPDSITLPLLWLGLLFNLFFSFVSLQQAVLGAAAGYLSLWLLFQAFKLITGKEGMGFGDFKLLAALGAWLGVSALPLIILMAALVGIAASIALKIGRGQPMAFGPALAFAGWIIFLFHQEAGQAIHWWLASSGFAT
ncbi:prepilin peptidase [Stenoxybacter acetivorans]|uniref:prepilin peptidase n=1 Tax=Stenoxybacter acetivorans TaxID=422441 RepID=UPI00055A2379|nr:A24 family peptidase [Stenoxybacter acetivorans]